MLSKTNVSVKKVVSVAAIKREIIQQHKLGHHSGHDIKLTRKLQIRRNVAILQTDETQLN